MSPMELLSLNYDEFLYEPSVQEPVLELRFPVESASFGLLQPRPSQAESSTSSPVFIKLPTELSFTVLMGLEDSYSGYCRRSRDIMRSG